MRPGNTVGKPGRLGTGIRCVVSVSMRTEDSDANTVTQVLGLCAFRTQLCEQVIGSLRRMSYATNSDGGMSAPKPHGTVLVPLLAAIRKYRESRVG